MNWSQSLFLCRPVNQPQGWHLSIWTYKYRPEEGLGKLLIKHELKKVEWLATKVQWEWIKNQDVLCNSKHWDTNTGPPVYLLCFHLHEDIWRRLWETQVCFYANCPTFIGLCHREWITHFEAGADPVGWDTLACKCLLKLSHTHDSDFKQLKIPEKHLLVLAETEPSSPGVTEPWGGFAWQPHCCFLFRCEPVI